MKRAHKLIIIFFLISLNVAADVKIAHDAYKKGDYETAAKELKISADNGNVDAQYHLGRMLILGDEIEKDEKEAEKYFRLAADNGNAKAQYHLGRMLILGDEIEKDEKEAEKYFRLAADNGNFDAQYEILKIESTIIFEEGFSKEELRRQENSLRNLIDAQKSIQMLQTQFEISLMKKGDCSSIENIQNEVMDGDLFRKYMLSELYFIGLCVKKDLKKGLRILEQVANSETDNISTNVGAMTDLARLFFLGNEERGVIQNKDIGVEWLKMAAENGDGDAQNYLGNLFLNGDTVRKDYKQAINWYSLAAEQNNEDALLNLTRIYLEGKFVEKDMDKVMKLLLRGSELGYPKLQFLYGSFLLEEDLIDASKQIEAYKWLNIASKEIDDAKKTLNELESLMNNSDILKAQEIASSWKPAGTDDINTQIYTTKLPKIEHIGEISRSQATKKLKENNIVISRDAFFQSIEEDNLEVFKLFIKAGASLNTTKINAIGITPLIHAINLDSKNIYNFLLDSDANINIRIQNNGQSALVRAIAWERWEVVDKLLNKNADASYPKYFEKNISIFPGSALSYILGFDKPDLLKKILNSGGSVNERYFSNETPLMHAVRENYPDNTKILLENGADIDAEDQHGRTALLHFIEKNEGKKINNAILNTLFKYGPTSKYDKKNSPIFSSIIIKKNIIDMFVKNGFDINEKYYYEKDQIPMSIEDPLFRKLLQNGCTPLMVSVLMGNIPITKSLMAHNADHNYAVTIDSELYTIKRLAEISGNEALIEFLR